MALVTPGFRAPACQSESEGCVGCIVKRDKAGRIGSYSVLNPVRAPNANAVCERVQEECWGAFKRTARSDFGLVSRPTICLPGYLVRSHFDRE